MQSSQPEEIDNALIEHDRRVAAQAPEIWLGAEPTFTDPHSEAPEWLSLADGGDKSIRALTLLARLAGRGLLLRTLGRQYAGETRPRWSYGLYRRRDGIPIWSGPPDPALGGGPSPQPALEAFAHALLRRLADAGCAARLLLPGRVAPEWRVVFRDDGLPCPAVDSDDRLDRPSVHEQPIPEEGLADSLSAEGNYLLVLARDPMLENPDQVMPRLELPGFPSVTLFVQTLECIGLAAGDAGVLGLVLAGHPPPVDGTIAWTTITPDPAVIEVNMAPSTCVSDFLGGVRDIYRAAEAEGLSPRRFHYNGDVTDSGGGGQITFGGPTPASSPFFLRPWLLSNVIRYFNRHPSLSYFFTPTCVGSASQSPRPDERCRESFPELKLALELLDREGEPTPETLAAALGPFLADLSGNSHRSEINIEKLWNPGARARGCQGLVEFRAFRMAPTPETLAARAALFRSLLAMLARCPLGLDLIDWGSELHERFALPYYLKQDLGHVLNDLDGAGLGIGESLARYLLDDSDRAIAEVVLGDMRLTVRRALEFWPLAGDAAVTERSPTRLVDSSTLRVEMLLQPLEPRAARMDAWQISAEGWRVPARREDDVSGSLLVFGLRYRSFRPWRGLHPTLAPTSPLRLRFRDRRTGRGWDVRLHEWKPAGGPYPGLPADLEQSRERRRDRLIVDSLAECPESPGLEPPPLAVGPYGIDLRACPTPGDTPPDQA